MPRESIEIALRLLDEQFQEAIENLKQELRELSAHVERVDSQRINIETDVDWQGEFAELQTAIRALEAQSIDLNVNASAAGAAAAGAAGRAGGPAMGRGTISRFFAQFAEEGSEAAGALSNFNISMSDVHNALARLIPVLFVFIGALPAAATAVATLAAAAVSAAAAFAAMGGLGLMGFAMARDEGTGVPSAEAFMEAFEEIRDSFFEAFAPLAQRLTPLFEDALNGLEALFQAAANQGDALMALTDEARAFGRFLGEFVPGLLRAMSALVEMFAPTFSQMASFVRANNIIEGFAAVTANALPPLRALTEQILLLLPGLMHASVGFLRVSAAVFGFFNAIGQVLSVLPISAETLGVLIATLLTLSSVIFVLNSQVIALAGKYLLQLGGAFMSASTMSGVFSASLATLRSAVYSVATSLFTLRAALAVTGLGVLVSVAGVVADQFVSAAVGIDSATASLERFQEIAEGTGGANPYGAPGLDPTATGQARTGGANFTIVEADDPQSFRREAESLLYGMEQES